MVKPMADALERLKILINSSTPIVVMETVEEMRAVSLVRAACADLNMAVFEWSIADGLVRSGSNVGDLDRRRPIAARGIPGHEKSGSSGASTTAGAGAGARQYGGHDAGSGIHPQGLPSPHGRPGYCTPLRDVGQKFSTNRRTLILTAPSIAIPPNSAA